MFKISWLTLNLILCALCAAFAITLYIFDINAMASMFVVALCFFGALLILPASMSRLKKEYSPLLNFLIVLSSAFAMLLLVFLIVAFAYNGLFKSKMFSFFEVVFYPATLAILLTEYTIYSMRKHLYKNSINSSEVGE